MANFNAETINTIWKKATIVPNNDPAVWRKDIAGAWIKRSEYGKKTKYGWEIDHKKPVAKGGTDNNTNLRPLHWENNESKNDDYPEWHSVVTASGADNVHKKQKWEIS